MRRFISLKWSWLFYKNICNEGMVLFFSKNNETTVFGSSLTFLIFRNSLMVALLYSQKQTKHFMCISQPDHHKSTQIFIKPYFCSSIWSFRRLIRIEKTHLGSKCSRIFISKVRFECNQSTKWTKDERLNIANILQCLEMLLYRQNAST